MSETKTDEIDSEVPLNYVLPQIGMIHEKASISPMLCMPKLLPVKGPKLLRMESLEAQKLAKASGRDQ
ncbi:hypothetical protein CRM22_000876 [Opisthorchis felineus]|uniref:Uncharacterized protein n=1 Tax=Opisthorchis felineus TaxID=147828 RepID=A0A4S2MD30_OPIFE|nr:hypothetical protein CRM22_000876 [Opisthorchis felineus]